MRRINIASPQFEYDGDDPEGFRSGMVRLGKLVGAEESGISVYIPFSLDVLTLAGQKIKGITAFVVRTADAPDGYSRWPEYAADTSRVQAVFERFGLPDHVD